MGNHKIVIAHVLRFEKQVEKRKPVVMLIQNEKDLTADIEEAEYFCPIVVKGLLGSVSVVIGMPRDIEELLSGFQELLSDEFPNELPPVRDKKLQPRKYEYHADGILYQDMNSGPSYLQVEDTDVGGLFVRNLTIYLKSASARAIEI